VGQQPNIEIQISDMPRPVPHPGPARRWRPERPGEVTTPEAMPWGGGFGTIGPDSGYALRLIGRRDLTLGAGEDRHGAERVIAAVSMARASHFGRAPIGQDLDVAWILFGLDPEGLPDAIAERLAQQRRALFAGAGHDYETVRTAVGSIPSDLLADSPDSVRRRIAEGEWPAA
jgi:hypothetical protein